MTTKPSEKEIQDFLELLVAQSDNLMQGASSNNNDALKRSDIIRKAKDLLVRINPDHYKNDFDIPVAELGLPVRVSNGLIAEGINNVSELLKHSETDIRKLPGMGSTSIKHIEIALAGYDWQKRIESGPYIGYELIYKELGDSDYSNLSIHNIGMPERYCNALESAGLNTVRDILSIKYFEVSKHPGVGYAGERYLRIALADLVRSKLDEKLQDSIRNLENGRRVDYERSIEDLGLHYRLAASLKRSGYETVGDVLKVPLKELGSIPGVGPSALKDIDAALSDYDWKTKLLRVGSILTAHK